MTGSTTIEAIGCSTANKNGGGGDNQVGVAISARRPFIAPFLFSSFFDLVKEFLSLFYTRANGEGV
jgi:hypothetical protein